MTKSPFIAVFCLLVPSTAAAQFTRMLPPENTAKRGPAVPTSPVDDGPGADAPEYYTPSVEEEPSAPKMNFEGLVTSFGSGYGTPMGEMMRAADGTGVALGDLISGQIPLLIGLGFRTGPIFSFGLSSQYAFLVTKNCDAGSTCSASDYRLGIEGRLHILAEEYFAPWFSFGVGYELLNLTVSGSSSGGASIQGFDFDFQLGGDVRISRAFVLGPFVGVRVGTYDSASATTSYTSTAGSIPEANRTTHGWLTFGVRCAFTFMPPLGRS